MKNLLALLTFTFVILLIGRNLTFLPRFELFSNQKTETNNLKSKVKQILSKEKASYSVYFADFNSDNFFGINEDQTYTAASINKVPIVAALYYLANKGQIDLDEKITLQKEDVQDYGTGSLRYQEPGSVYSLRTLAKLALQQSDNTATYIIATKIGFDNLQKTIDNFGLTQTNINDNKTSVYDMYLLFKKIYKKEITTPTLTKEMLSFLKDTDIEDRLPLLLPKDVNIYHKAGDGQGNIHDVGIIEKDNTVFFLGIMTSDVGDQEDKTKKVIAEIAKESYDSFLRQK